MPGTHQAPSLVERTAETENKIENFVGQNKNGFISKSNSYVEAKEKMHFVLNFPPVDDVQPLLGERASVCIEVSSGDKYEE